MPIAHTASPGRNATETKPKPQEFGSGNRKPANSPGPLRQGDILQGLELYMSTYDGAATDSVPFCVVLSRDCNALRSPSIVVAEICTYVPEEFNEAFFAKGLDAARRRLDALRDGDGRPDRCYLGPLLEGEVRYAVSLDRIHTVEVPVDSRDTWITAHRVF